MRDLTDLRGWTIALTTMGLAIVTRRRRRIQRLRMRPQVTPLRLIHPDELDYSSDVWKRAI